MIYLREDDIRSLLSMPDAIDLVRRAFAARTAELAFDVPRERTRMPGGHLNIMQGGSIELGLLGFKAYYRGTDVLTSHLHLINRRTGRTEAIIESNWLGQMRTGAATAVAATYLSRLDSQIVGVFGSGQQAGTQLEALCHVHNITEFKVFSRDPERLRAFCTAMEARLGKMVRPAASAKETVRGSDILVTVTPGGGPVFEAAWLEPGQFIAAVGVNSLDRREIDRDVVQQAAFIVVDSRYTAQRESGDLLSAFEAGLVHWEMMVELGDIITERHFGRTDPSQVILFESHGMALQDIYCGAHVLGAAMANGLGQRISPVPV